METSHRCIDAAVAMLERRAHSRSELQRKLKRKKYSDDVIDAALAELQRRGHINDERFAEMRATSAARHKHHGPRRILSDLMRAGVSSESARKAVGQVYSQSSAADAARELAMKQAPRLRKLDPVKAKRRLAGTLLRRGFDHEAVKSAIAAALGQAVDDD
jgi:regulatory protein